MKLPKDGESYDEAYWKAKSNETLVAAQHLFGFTSPVYEHTRDSTTASGRSTLFVMVTTSYWSVPEVAATSSLNFVRGEAGRNRTVTRSSVDPIQ